MNVRVGTANILKTISFQCALLVCSKQDVTQIRSFSYSVIRLPLFQLMIWRTPKWELLPFAIITRKKSKQELSPFAIITKSSTFLLKMIPPILLGFPLEEMTNNFTVKLPRNCFIPKLYLIFKWKTLTFLLLKIRLLLLRMLTWTENKNEWIFRIFYFCSTFISIIGIKQETEAIFYFVNQTFRKLV